MYKAAEDAKKFRLQSKVDNSDNDMIVGIEKNFVELNISTEGLKIHHVSDKQFDTPPYEQKNDALFTNVGNPGE